MDIGRAFSFVFEDENWIVKILIAAAILLAGVVFSWVLIIPLLLAFILVSGYSAEITRRVIRGNPDELPEWDDWGQFFGDGLKVWVIGIVYALPIIIVSICLAIPSGLLAEEAEGLSAVMGVCIGCISLLWAVVMSVTLPAAIAFYVDEEDLGAAFRFGDIFAFVRENLSTYLLTFVMSWVANLIGSLGSIVCGVGWLVTGPYAWMVTGNLYGQAYLEGKGQVVETEFE
jgi:hypothetical protein